MLTKDLLRFKTVSGRIHPLFIAPDDRALLAFASSIVNTYRDSLRYPRSEIQESLAPLINSQRDLKLAKGILKLYDDLCGYSGDSEADCPAMRRSAMLYFPSSCSGVRSGSFTSCSQSGRSG